MTTALWQFIYDNLYRLKPVMLLCVVESHGSSPGRQGFKMAVTEEEMQGSIGGGVMEHKFVELAKEMLRSKSNDSLIRKQLHNKSAPKDQSGMICSGEQTIVIFHLTKQDLENVQRILDTIKVHRSGILQLTHSVFQFNQNSDEPDMFEMKSENEWYYREQIGHKNHLYIIGGGHCSKAFSKLMYSMDFYIHLYEERRDLNTFVTNEYVHEKVLVQDYSSLSDFIPSGNNHYVVIMTFGYRTDDIALRSLIRNQYKYLGILGSKAKIGKMMSDWKRDNLPNEKLKSLHAPVGISINSQTTEEIAISIAAEIISIKNNSSL